MRNLIRAISAPFHIIRNKIFLLIFLNGFLLALVAYFFVEDNYEAQIFKALGKQVTEITGNSNNIDTILATAVNLTYNLEKFRQNVFVNKHISTIKSDLIRPVTFDLLTGSGACGSYSYVLSRLLREFKIETRFAQMKVDGKFGGHITVEAKSGSRWIALDPSYNMIFHRKDGNGFASFADVQHDWAYYSQQLPADYDPRYNYSDVQYTNWNRIPVVMPMIKSVLSFFMGREKVEEMSLRNIFLSKFNILFRVTGALYLIIVVFLLRAYKRQKEEIENFRLSLLFPKAVPFKVAGKHAAA